MRMIFPRRMRGLASILLLLCVCGGMDSLAVAAPITWGTPQTISGDSDVSTIGSLVYAYSVGPSTVVSSTVNGVTFAAYPFPVSHTAQTVTVGSVTMTESPNSLVAFNVASALGPYSELSTAYKTMLDTGGGAGDPNAITMTFGGLSIGQPYLFQWWASNALNFHPWNAASASATNSVTLDANIADTNGGLGQFVTGTFTADGVTQDIVLTGVGGQPLINAFQIRAVPEPSTYVMALAGLACGGYLVRRHRS